MPTLVEYFRRQSNKGNWSYQDQLCGSDNQPLWTSDPTGISASIVAVDRKGCIGFQISTGDGSDQLLLDANGIINVNVTPETLGALSPDMYDIHITVASDDFTINRIYGRLPIYEGFVLSSTNTMTGSASVGPKVSVWQLKVALVNAGVFSTVEAAIVPATNDPKNIVWTSGGDTRLNDALSLVIQGILGWTDNQMATLYNSASAILSIA